MPISINIVRNTTMAILAKNNRGFIKPDDFNLFCRMAQMSIFEDLFTQYNQWLNKQNRRLSNTDYADLPKHLREIIDVFSEFSTPANFTYNATTNLWSYTGTDFYRTINLSLVNGNKKIDIEETGKSGLNVMMNSDLTKPTLTFPVYVKLGESFRVYPTLTTPVFAELTYLRTPRDPKWTYVNTFGNPVYNASDPTLQNIELPESLFATLCVKVLSYAGVQLREQELLTLASNEEAIDKQEKAQA